jgi:hypothetical protein
VGGGGGAFFCCCYVKEEDEERNDIKMDVKMAQKDSRGVCIFEIDKFGEEWR